MHELVCESFELCLVYSKKFHNTLSLMYIQLYTIRFNYLYDWFSVITVSMWQFIKTRINIIYDYESRICIHDSIFPIILMLTEFEKIHDQFFLIILKFSGSEKINSECSQKMYFIWNINISSVHWPFSRTHLSFVRVYSRLLTVLFPYELTPTIITIFSIYIFNPTNCTLECTFLDLVPIFIVVF